MIAKLQFKLSTALIVIACVAYFMAKTRSLNAFLFVCGFHAVFGTAEYVGRRADFDSASFGVRAFGRFAAAVMGGLCGAFLGLIAAMCVRAADSYPAVMVLFATIGTMVGAGFPRHTQRVFSTLADLFSFFGR